MPLGPPDNFKTIFLPDPRFLEKHKKHNFLHFLSFGTFWDFFGHIFRFISSKEKTTSEQFPQVFRGHAECFIKNDICGQKPVFPRKWLKTLKNIKNELFYRLDRVAFTKFDQR